MKIAAYLDQAGEDPLSACKNLVKHKISHVALKRIWTNNVDSVSDNICQDLKKLLVDYDISPILVASNLGNVPANRLNHIKESEIKRVFNLVSYFKTNYVRVFLGTKCNDDCSVIIDNWISRIIEYSVLFNVVPVYEVSPDSYYFSHIDLAKILNKYKKLKLLYDPAQFLLRQNMDLFVKYWLLLKDNISLFDVRDIKVGRGYKPAGLGDAKLDLTIADSLDSFSGWYILEPSLGRRYSNYVGKEEIFGIALKAFQDIVQKRVDHDKSK